MMKHLVFAVLILTSAASDSRAASLTLTIQNGVVSLNAQDVTARQILTEWARVGKTQFVNLERLTGTPMTLQFERLPEKQALDVILRAVPGYVAAPRETPVADASIYARVLVMPTTTVVAALKQPPQTAPGYLSGFQGGPNFTQLRPGMVPFQGNVPEPNDPALDQMNDPAIAAAAAAGLIPVPAAVPGMLPPATPLAGPGTGQASPPQATQPAAAVPSNPWNAPVGTAQPSLAPPPAPATTPNAVPPQMRPRPPQADQ